MKIRDIVEKNDSLGGRIFDLTIIALIIISIITFTIETIPDLPPRVRSILQLSEIIIVAIFTVEYILRIFLAKRKLKYIFSFYGIIDILAILPFYLSAGLDLRSLRIFRLLRLFRLLKVVRYNKAIRIFLRAFTITKEEIILFLIATSMMLFLAASGIYYFEHKAQPEVFKSFFHSLWWAVTTLTTVGYGDMYPITAGGKIFSFVILMIGLGIVAVPAGLVASALSKARMEEPDEKNHS